MNRIQNTISLTTILSVLIFSLIFNSSCSQDLDIQSYQKRIPTRDTVSRTNSEETRRTLLLYSAGYHNLSEDLCEDIRDLCNGYLPGNERYDDQIFIFSHQTASKYDYSTPTHAYLLKVYKNSAGGHTVDTLMTYPEGTSSASAKTFAMVTDYVYNTYPSKEFGVIFSSHATGWLPEEYYSKNTFSARYTSGQRPHSNNYCTPLVKSIGAEFCGSYLNVKEIDLKEFAAELKTHLDFLIFDACLMGGIEVAYELKDVCDKIVFSQTEVLSWGMDYTKIGSRLFSGKESDLRGIAEDFFNFYDALSGDFRSATISVVDCSQLDNLAKVCSGIFRNHRNELMTISPVNVQRFNRKPWFFDFRDILANLGLNQEEKDAVDEALSRCILYKASTPKFIGIDITAHSGLSMYLERAGNRFLSTYYSDLKWNTDTNYVL